MDFPKKGKLITIRKRAKPAAFLTAFLFIYLQVFSVFADDPFTVVSGGFDGYTCDASGCTFTGLQDGTIINWNGFNVDFGSSLNFLFSMAGGSVLNNDISGAASNIFGSIFSNGYVFLINPAGINIGASASINVAGFLASSLNISNANFISGNYVFENGAQAGTVINEGTITTQPGGFVALLGSSVANSGSIIADLGSIVLASGEKMTLTFDPNGLINLVVDEALASKVTDAQDAILNSGILKAAGGKIILHAEAVNDLFTYLVNNTGIIEATSVVNRNGVIELVAVGGAISNTGIIDASGSVENPNGGTINILGDVIEHAGSILANAFSQGTAGNIDVISLYGTYLLSGSVISARGIGELSQGGNIYVNALYGSTDFQQDALIDISGGLTGNGGTLDLSAFGGDLHVGGTVYQVVADGYTGGLVIFDPDGNITISTNQILAGDILLLSNGGIIINNNIIVQSTGGTITVVTDANNTNDDGVFTMNSGSKLLAFNGVTIDGSSAAAATLREISTTNGQILIGTNRAFDSVTINGGNIGVPYLSAPGGITVMANNGISISNNPNVGVFYEIESTNGNVFLNADADGNGSGTFTMANNSGILAGGNIEIYGSGNTTIRNVSATGIASQVIIGTGASTSFNNITLAGLTQGNGGVTVNAFNNLSVNNNVQSVAGNINLNAVNNVSISSNTTVQSTGGGNITILANSDGDTSGNFSMANNSSVITNGGDISVSGRSNITVRTLDAGTGNVSVTSTAGSILDDNDNTTKITGDAVTLTAANAIGQNSGNNDIDLSANSLNATASNGLIRATNDKALIVNSASSTNGSVTIGAAGNLTVTNASATGTGTNDINLTATTGDLTLGTVNAENTVTVNATAGNILDDGNQATAVFGSSVNMTATGNIGSVAANGDVDISSTTNIGALTSSGNGDIFARISGGGANLTGADFVTAGSVTVTTEGTSSVTGATGYNNFSMIATSGNLEVGTVSATNTVILAASNGDVTDTNADSSVTGSTVNITAGGADGDIGTTTNKINTTAGTLNLTGAGTGDVFVTESNGVTVGATTGSGNINVTSTTGDLTLGTISTTGNITLTALAGDLLGGVASSVAGAIVNLIAGGADGDVGQTGAAINTTATTLNLTGTGTGEINVTESNGATVGATTDSGNINVTTTTGDLSVGTVSTTGNMTLSALAGDILDATSNLVGNIINLIAGGADGDIGTTTNKINTTAGTLNLTGAGTGDVFVTESNGVTVGATTGSGNINVTSTTGDLTLGTISTTGNITLTALAGDLLGGVASSVAGAIVNLIAGGADGDVGQTGAAINTTATTLNLTGTGTGEINVTESNGATVGATTDSGNINVTTTTGDLTLIDFSTTGDVSLTATAGNIVDDFIQSTRIDANSLTMTALGNIGSALANGDIDFNTTTFVAQSTGNGNIAVNSLTGMNFTSANFLTAGAVNVTAGGASSATGINGYSDFSLTTTAGDITVGDVTTTNSASFTAQAGNIVDDGNVATKVTSNTISFSGNAVGTLINKINTAATTINAISQTGGIFIMEEDGATVNANSSVANGDICIITPTGDLILGTINAGNGSVMLEATAGNVLDGNGAANNITAGTNSSIVAGGTIGATGDGIDVDINNGAVLTTTAGGQDGGGTSINIDGDINGELVNPVTDLDFDLGGPNQPSGNVFFNNNLLFPIFVPAVPAAISGVTGLSGIDFTQLLSPLFPQWSTRRQPALFA